MVAEKLAQVEIYRESKLWSPKFTPKQFKWLFLVPMAMGVSLVCYLHFIQIPKRMLYYKQKKGWVFPGLENLGMLKDWIVEDYHDEIYPDEILQDLSTISQAKVTERQALVTEEALNRQEIQLKNQKAMMSNKYDQIYTARKKLDL